MVGVTGGIGSGKTAVTDRFAARGITVADADVASRTVVEPGTPALASIVDHFGKEVLQPDGTLDRAALRAVVFQDAAERRWLESVTVPAIMSELMRILRESKSPYSILMLSSGSGQSPLIHRSLVVDVPREIQIQRVTARDSTSADQVEAIMAAQPSREQRLAYADDVIVNDASLDELDEQVEKLHQQYLRLAKAHHLNESHESHKPHE